MQFNIVAQTQIFHKGHYKVLDKPEGVLKLNLLGYEI